jgi:phosphatidylglycerol:prolipoprotein diacylglycerol transferase
MWPMSASVWVHDLNPFVVRFSESFGIRWYGLAYLTGFVVGALFMIFLAKRGRGTISPTRVVDFITYVVLGTMLGGRLGYVLFYGHELLFDFSSKAPYWGALRVWEGGMSSHGGILGVMLASVLFARRYKMQWLHLGDLVTLGGSIGIFFGRLANFVNGELFGREAPSTAWYAMKFPNEMYLWLRHDIGRNLSEPASSPDLVPKMTEAVKALGPASELQFHADLAQLHTSTTAQTGITVLIEKIVHAIQGGSVSVRTALGSELTPRYPSQLIEAVLEGLLLFVISLWFWRKPHKPGVVGGVWLTIYAVVRIFGEQFRMPDAHLGYQLFGLTRGQWLSIAMLASSAVLLILAMRSETLKIGGWGPQARRLRETSPLPYQGETKIPPLC